MSAEIKSTKTSAGSKKFSWPYGLKNYLILLAGLVIVGVGYLFLGKGPFDSVASTTVGPVLLVIGYLFVIPAALFIRGKGEE